MKINWKKLIKNLAIPLVVGSLSGFLTRNAMKHYLELNQPPLSPPSLTFPIVWTILFTLMGISAYLVETKSPEDTSGIPAVYWLQLAVNFVWPLIFFNLSIYWLAFFWLLLLISLVITMIFQFLRISQTAGWLQIPYLLWLIFATYLNIGVWMLN